MKRILSLLLSLTLLLSSVTFLFSCGIGFPEIPTSDGPTLSDDGREEIIKPELKDDPDRNTIKFSEIEYSRPNIEKMISDFEGATEKISDDSLSFEEKLDGIIALEESYTHLYTMLSYSRIKRSEDNSNSYWNDEYAYISENYPTFAKTLEALFVAAASSSDAERFEDEYFGEGLIEKYKDGGTLTDELVRLTTLETELENEYSEISEANTEITYGGVTDTCDALLSEYEALYANDPKAYSKIREEINALYESAKSKKAVEIYVDLVKVRRDIADERGHDSFVIHAYEQIDHEYTEDKLLAFTDEVAKHVVPVWATLEAYVFSTMKESSANALNRVSLINRLYGAYEKMDGELRDAYSYMLKYELYNVELASAKRDNGSFATYLEAFDAPYLFVTTEGSNSDYLTMAHEFGHFFDSFVNHGADTSIDLSEVSSTSLEYLTFLGIAEALGSDARDIHFSLVRDALSVLVFQSFYALFEHNVYALDESDISETNIVNAMLRAADAMGLNKNAFVPDPDEGIYHALDYVLIPHVFISPCYVESYCTSTAVSLQLYFLEKSNTGEGVKTYLDLIKRDGEALMFEDYIVASGLRSPFESGLVRDLAYKLYYDILGDYGYNENVGISKRSARPAA